MTVIIGLKHEGQVWVGADSFCSNGDLSSRVASPKVFRVHEPNNKRPILMASCGDVRAHQLLRYGFQVPALVSGVDLMHYLVCDFCEAARARLREGGVVFKEDGADGFQGGLLLAMENRLFVLTRGFSVEESVRPFYAFGAGGEFASGALFGSAHLEPESRVRQAMEAAADLSPSVCGPFYIEKL